jgi:transmembrane sensor
VVREALTIEALSALDPREAAAHFIARRAEGLTPSEEDLLKTWLAQDEAHARLLESADRAWQSFDDADGDEILSAMRAHALAPQRRRGASWPRIVIGAGLVAAACAALVLLLPRLEPVAGVEYASARGEVREVQLADGSIMTLDANSAAVVQFTDASRAIELESGRAYFDVAHDQARPLVVTASTARVVALGTRFDVNLGVDEMTVTLLEGSVRIEHRDAALDPVVLEPGQQYVERDGRALVRTIGAGSENVVAWRTGFINFDDQALSEAAAVMNRYTQDQIVINDQSIAAIRVSGQFRAGETSRFAETLAEVHDLRLVRQGTELELTR